MLCKIANLQTWLYHQNNAAADSLLVSDLFISSTAVDLYGGYSMLSEWSVGLYALNIQGSWFMVQGSLRQVIYVTTVGWLVGQINHAQVFPLAGLAVLL